MTFAVRRDEQQYPNLSDFLEVSGSHLVFPGGLREKVEEAAIFSADGNDVDHVMVELRSGKIRIKGSGTSGWHQTMAKVGYTGEPLRFMVAPKLLCEFSDRVNECTVSKDRLLVQGPSYTWVGNLVVLE